MAARIDIPSVYDEVRKAYSGMGYPVSGDRLVLSEQPTYVDGRPVPKDVLNPRTSGGNTQHDGTVRINPRYRAVMRHWKIKGSGRDFLRTIIGHELGHHIDRTVLSGRSAERRRLLREISRSGFHTVYTDSYGPDTDPRKLDKELLAEYLAKQVSARLGKSASAVEFHDGTYGDVKAVYDALTDEEKDFVTPHRRVYKDVTPLARTVAYSDSVPVGFADLYGREGRASLCLAVAKAARGKGLAGEMARTSIRKLLNAMAEDKRKAREAGGKELEAWRKQSRIRRFVWGLDARNDRSAHAAARAGFTEQEFKKPHKYRRFVMTRGEAERMLDKAEKQAQVFSQDGRTVTLSKGQTPGHVVRAYNRDNPGSRITVQQFLKANGNLAATKFRAGKAYNMPVSTAAATVPSKPVAIAAPAPAPSAGPIGFRQNNPGNLRSDGKTLWQGATGVPAAGEFLTFSSPYHGVRAMARTLFNYGRLHNINSLEGVVDRYAPASENNQAAYLSSVRQKTGLKPGARLDLTDEGTLQRLVPAMGAHEIGPQYFSTYSPALVSNAVARAMR